MYMIAINMPTNYWTIAWRRNSDLSKGISMQRNALEN